MNNIEKLKKLSKEMGVSDIANYILDDSRFSICSGSSKKNQHHYGDGGLANHTLEVVELCMLNLEFIQKKLMIPVNEYTYVNENPHKHMKVELFLAALFHDSGKMFDYHRVHSTTWESAPHKRLIHHISRSAIIWTEAINYVYKDEEDINYKYIFEQRYYEPVLHAILSHHMAREYGSPVAPKTRVAWLLTLCDNMSARMNDADKWDVIEGYKQ